MSGACSSPLGLLFGWHNFVSMRCGPALLGSHTLDIHNTAHETTTQDTRSTRPQHADVTTHHEQHSKITTSCSSFISPLLSMSSRVSTLHIVFRSRTASRLVTVTVYARRSVLFRLMVRPWVPHACADHSGHTHSLHQTGLCIRLRRSPSALANRLGCLWVFLFLFSVWFTAGRPYRECLH